MADLQEDEQLEQFILDVAGVDREDISDDEFEELRKAFVEAGQAAVHSRRGTPTKVGAAMRTARKIQVQSRERLAEITTPSDNDVVTDRTWRPYFRAVDDHVEALIGADGVTGAAVGYRSRDDVWQDERVATVFVEEKKPEADLTEPERIPESIPDPSTGKDVPTDIVEAGLLELQAHPGDEIKSAVNSGSFGVAAFDPDNPRKPFVITAMHVVSDREEYDIDEESGDVEVEIQCTRDGTTLTGVVMKGTTRGIDAARINLTGDASVENVIPQVGRVQGSRPLEMSDVPLAVQIYGATTGRLVDGTLRYVGATYPRYQISGALLGTIPTNNGDSGSVLVDQHGFALGIHRGVLGDYAVFSPIKKVLKALEGRGIW